MPKILMHTHGNTYEKDFPKNHCVFCKHISGTIKEEPCRTCLHTDPRNRPMFEPKEAKMVRTSTMQRRTKHALRRTR